MSGAGIDPRHALDALHAIDPGCTRDEWFRVGASAIAAGLTVDDVDRWSSAAANYGGERDVRAAFRTVKVGGKVGAGTLWYLAKASGWKPPKDGQRRVAPPLRAAPPQARREAAQHATLSAYGRALWRACRALDGEAAAYLTARGCVIPPGDGDLRCHSALRHPPSGAVGSALVALVTDAVTGEPLTLHRTWVCSDGNKAPVTLPRMLLGGHRKSGGVIRLWPDEAVTTGLAIAEGIETALSLAHAFKPVWSCIDAGNMATLAVLEGVESLFIAADNDEAGVKAAETCARRWALAGREVRIGMPDARKADLNDVARASA